MPLFKKKDPVQRTPANHYSVQALTSRTKVIRDRIPLFENMSRVSEEATKEQLIYPFFEAFGWDIKNPRTAQFEVIAGGRNKADLMLAKNHAVKIVVEAKAFGKDINDDTFKNQIKGYFENCHASIGILTNGVQYDFFSYEAHGMAMNITPFASLDIRSPQFGGKNGFIMYMCQPTLDIDALIDLGRVMFVTGEKKRCKRYDPADRTVREAFARAFPHASPQKLDELIVFANYQCL